MIYITMSLIGIAAVVALRQKWTQNFKIFFVLMTIILGSILLVLANYSYLISKGFIVKGSSIIDEIPWIEIGLYFAMLLGMVAKYLYDAIGEGNKIVIRKYQLIKPFLVSPIVFGMIYGGLSENSPALILLIFSFQNGFFWQTVLIKAK
jgi:hypothetical protein